MRISSAAISDSINVEDISSPVKCSNGALDLESITAQISGGRNPRKFSCGSDQFGLCRIGCSFQVTGVNINEIVSRAGGILDRAHGILQGSFQLAGYMKDPSLASGDGSLEIKTGYLDQYPMLKELGRWTQIDELQRLDLEQALSKFSVVGQDIKVDSLQLISKNCQVNLSGTVGSAQKLDLNGRLTVSQFLSQKIPNELEENFAKSKDGESRYLDFQVTGSVLKPQTDLFERIIGDKGKLLKKLFRTDHKEKRQRSGSGRFRASWNAIKWLIWSRCLPVLAVYAVEQVSIFCCDRSGKSACLALLPPYESYRRVCWRHSIENSASRFASDHGHGARSRVLGFGGLGGGRPRSRSFRRFRRLRDRSLKPRRRRSRFRGQSPEIH